MYYVPEGDELGVRASIYTHTGREGEAIPIPEGRTRGRGDDGLPVCRWDEDEGRGIVYCVGEGKKSLTFSHHARGRAALTL